MGRRPEATMTYEVGPMTDPWTMLALINVVMELYLKSRLITYMYGVPQLSNLGLLLFLLYINDLTNVSQVLKLVLFADDSTAFLEHCSLAELEIQANSELQKLAEWFKANKLSLNVSKTCYMSFTSSKKKGSSYL